MTGVKSFHLCIHQNAPRTASSVPEQLSRTRSRITFVSEFDLDKESMVRMATVDWPPRGYQNGPGANTTMPAENRSKVKQ